MGSLTSTPKVAHASAKAEQTPASNNASIAAASKEAERQAEKEAQAKARELKSKERKKSLLARDRSRAGTIGTTLKGVLSDSDESLERKTLLGQ